MAKTLSLCLIVKNEEKRLDRCLHSYRNVADEIIVVDTGSTDGTVAVAEKYGARIVVSPWENDFSKARNLSIDLATSDWILWTDADDIIDEANAVKIHKVLDQYPADTAFSFMIKNSQDGILGDVFNQIRLFPNHPAIRFRYRVHEQVLPAIQEQGLSVYYTDIMVIHTGYAGGPDVIQAKQRRNLAILEQEIQERPDNPVIAYSYAGAMADLDDIDNAVVWYEKALNLAKPQAGDPHIAQGVPITLAALYGRKKDYVHSRRWINEAVKKSPDHPQVLSILGELAGIEGRNAESVRYFEQVLECREVPVFLPVDVNMLKINACAKLGGLYLKLGRADKMTAILDQAMEIRLGRKLLPSDRGDRLYEQKELLKAGQEYLKAVNDPNSDDWKSFLGLSKIFIMDNAVRDALDVLELGFKRFPENEAITALLADLYNDLKLNEKARPLYQRLAVTAKDETLKARARRASGSA